MNDNNINENVHPLNRIFAAQYPLYSSTHQKNLRKL